MSYFSSDSKFKDLIEKPKDISSLLQEKMLLISGDFYGIQKFIFERLSTKHASKVLRAKSAYIELFTDYLAQYICAELHIDKEQYILSKKAGKFEILVPFTTVDLDAIQSRVDRFFIQNFYGLTGVTLSQTPCTPEDFQKPSEKNLNTLFDSNPNHSNPNHVFSRKDKFFIIFREPSIVS